MSTPSHTHQHASGTPHSHSNGHASEGIVREGPTTPTTSAAAGSSSGAAGTTSLPLPHIRIVPHLDAPRSLHFEVVDKDVPEGFVLKIGRFTDKQSFSNRITFKSKVVSRGHAEIFTEQGKFYIRDTKSSSGTFLNHARLSPPNVESKPTQLKDGDVVQLGVDYQGGTQEIYRCVKMRLELNRSWQQQANPFRMNTLKAIRSLTTADAASSTDCCICLFRIASFQSLFVAPCSHVYHYKCIRPLLMSTHPGFLCPLCRTFANLDDNVEIDDPSEEDIPAEEVAAAIEKVHRVQDASVEQVREDPVARVEPPVAEVIAEEAFAPTPPSEQAHTFQPPEDLNYPTGAEALSQATQAQQSNSDRDLTMHSARAFRNGGNEDNQQDTVMTSNSAPSLQSSLTGSGSSPMNIAAPSAIITSTSSAQQSPSSAFFNAPSPPFSSSATATPISLGSPQRSQASHVSTSPSTQLAAAGNMIQNVIRNISIPSRGRNRTNSNSPLNPIVQQSAAAVGSSMREGPVISSPPTSHPVGHGDGHGDVLGKTLVTTPPHSSVGSGNSRHESTNSNTGRASELGSVTEMESERASSFHYNMNNGSRVYMEGVQVDGEGESESVPSQQGDLLQTAAAASEASV